MSGSVRRIDARGLACPQPVVLAKKALEEGGPEALEVLVDGETARENVLRFAGYSGRRAQASPAEGGATLVLIEAAPAGAAAEGALGDRGAPGAAASPEAAPRGGAAGRIATVLLASDRLGRGDDELGALLMRGFTYALAEGEAKPDRVILMNGGVKLAVEGSESLPNLKRLAEVGVDVMACGTCLDYYKLKDALAVGRVTNMYEIEELLMKGEVLAP